MSFFNFDEPVTGNFETGGGDMTPIPAKTQVLAAPDEAKWVSPQSGDPDYIEIRWSILQPKEYENRKIFHKLRVNDGDSKKADKAKRMLAAIDANAGGKLMAAGVEPTDQSLTVNLVNKMMMLMLQVWEMEIDGQAKTGNWVSAVSPKGGAVSAPAPAAREAQPQRAAASGGFDDDIPFK